MAAHVAALFAKLGENQGRQWLEGLKGASLLCAPFFILFLADGAHRSDAPYQSAGEVLPDWHCALPRTAADFGGVLAITKKLFFITSKMTVFLQILKNG